MLSFAGKLWKVWPASRAGVITAQQQSALPATRSHTQAMARPLMMIAYLRPCSRNLPSQAALSRTSSKGLFSTKSHSGRLCLHLHHQRIRRLNCRGTSISPLVSQLRIQTTFERYSVSYRRRRLDMERSQGCKTSTLTNPIPRHSRLNCMTFYIDEALSCI